MQLPQLSKSLSGSCVDGECGSVRDKVHAGRRAAECSGREGHCWRGFCR